MIRFDAWFFPDHEKHLQENMLRVNRRVEGRLAYQYHKYEAAFKACTNFASVLDVGAHVGLFSYWAARRFEQVVAFEPVAEHRECFAANVEAGNVVLHDCALGAVEGAVSIETAPGSSGDSRVQSGGDVPLKRLDSFNLNNVGLIKIDCEGFEENVLIGGLETILRNKPVVIVEQKRDMAARFGLKPQGAVVFLKHLGYKQAVELGGDFIMVP